VLDGVDGKRRKRGRHDSIEENKYHKPGKKNSVKVGGAIFGQRSVAGVLTGGETLRRARE